MFAGLLLILTTSFSAFAGEEEWPTLDEINIGDSFKYPLLGIPGHEIRPTQKGVGLQAVKVKKKEFEKMSHDQLKHALEKDPIPVVAAPDGNFYIIDHHHQALAAHGIGRENAFFVLRADFSKFRDMDEFWRKMKAKKWVRELDHLGSPIEIPGGLPKSILKMVDDPYRSLAWFVRKLGGYRKTAVEYAEFLWADFFRSRVKLTAREDLAEKAKEIEPIAHSDAAKGLPGWSKHRVKCITYLWAADGGGY